MGDPENGEEHGSEQDRGKNRRSSWDTLWYHGVDRSRKIKKEKVQATRE